MMHGEVCGRGFRLLPLKHPTVGASLLQPEELAPHIPRKSRLFCAQCGEGEACPLALGVFSSVCPLPSPSSTSESLPTARTTADMTLR